MGEFLTFVLLCSVYGILCCLMIARRLPGNNVTGEWVMRIMANFFAVQMKGWKFDTLALRWTNILDWIYNFVEAATFLFIELKLIFFSWLTLLKVFYCFNLKCFSKKFVGDTKGVLTSYFFCLTDVPQKTQKQNKLKTFLTSFSSSLISFLFQN